MNPEAAVGRGGDPSPCILIVDDDRRILELLEIAFTAHGFRVLTAPDGEEATRLTLAERPDLVVLDVRLPKKSGLEVCEWLRRDPDDPLVPILVLSAVTDTETRLQAFTRGADDYLTKPFSPKELIARVKRLLARSASARQAQARQAELEREASHAREEAKRVLASAQREQRLRDLGFGLGLDLLEVLDEDELAGRLLPLARLRLGAGIAGLLLPDPASGRLAPAAARGDGLDRLAGLELAPDGPLGALLAGLERPVARRDLERFPDLAEEVAPFVAEGISLLVPLRGPAGLEGVLVLDERGDGLPFPPFEVELLASLARLAGIALHNARRARRHAERALAELALRTDAGRARGLAEGALLVESAARATLLPPRQRRALLQAVRLGRGAATGEVAEALARLAAEDPTGTARDLRRLVARALGAEPPGESGPEEDRAAVLLAVALAHAEERERGADGPAALARALAVAGARLDPITGQALEAAARELELDAPAVA